MILHNIQTDVYAVILTNDGYLRVWNCSRIACMGGSDILMDSTNKILIQGAQSFMLKKGVEIEDDILLGLYVNSNIESKFFILELIINENEQPVFSIINYLIPPFVRKFFAHIRTY